MRDLLFPSSPAHRAALRAGARLQAAGFVQECRAMVAMLEAAPEDQREFVAGEIACMLHLAPRTGQARLCTALSLLAQPVLVAALELGRLGVGHAMAVLAEISHLNPALAAQVLDKVLGDGETEIELTGGELRARVKRAIVTVDADAAKKRHQEAKKSAGVRGRPGVDGMGQVIIDCTAVEMATALAAIKGRAAAMSFEDPDLTQGQKEVAAFLHALGCDRTSVQAVIECPVERAVDLHAVAGAGVWSVDVRMPVAVALGLSDHPAVLAGYGPIGADEARALLPQADLVRACVDAETGEVLTVDPPVRCRSWRAGDPHAARALRDRLVAMATSGGTIPDLTCDGYVPSEALGRLVDLRDVTSTFPGDSTPARRSDRDHRLPYPLGPTAEWNLQNAARRWHRAKHHGWRTALLDDGTIRWTTPGGGVYDRRPKRTKPPDIPPGTKLPPLPDET
ncbi:MAG: 13E12 repeat family protein [Actinomycetota bacterium]|nr:13E12 repeat family protein [Actinomycetota bacterium]